MFKLRFNKKIALGDNLSRQAIQIEGGIPPCYLNKGAGKVRFSVVRKVPYTFLHHKRGVVLFIVLGTLLVVVSFATVILSLILSHARLTHHQTGRIQAYYAALAGMNYSLEMLRIGPASGGWAVGTNCTVGSPCTMSFADGDFKPSILVNPTNGVTITIRTAGSAGCSSPPAPTGGACISTTSTYTYTP